LSNRDRFSHGKHFVYGNETIVGPSLSQTKHAKPQSFNMPSTKKSNAKLQTPPSSAKRVVPKSPTSDSSIFSHPSDKLEQSIVKQLAKDIEELGGGFEAFFAKNAKEQVLSKLLDERHKAGYKAYGSRGAPVREAIRRRFYQWRKYVAEGDYAAKVLIRYKIAAYSVKKRPTKQLKTPQEEQSLGSVSSSSLSSNSGSESPKKPKEIKEDPSPHRPRAIFVDMASIEVVKSNGRPVPAVLMAIGVDRLEPGKKRRSRLYSFLRARLTSACPPFLSVFVRLFR
jgi:hypothetical protein